LWGGVHILFLIGFRNRLLVLVNWFWGWLLSARDARLITGDARIDIEIPRPPDFVPSEPSAAHGDGEAVPHEAVAELPGKQERAGNP
jgi:NADH dehydrogenase